MLAHPVVQRLIRYSGAFGTLAIFAALLVFLYDDEVSPRVIALLGLGLASLAVWVLFAPDDLRNWITGRQASAGTTSLVISLLFIALVVVVYTQADRSNLTVDFTQGERFSLNQPSLDALERLEESGRTVRIVGFYPRQLLRERETADVILRQYDLEGGDSLEVDLVDPDEEPLLARQYGYTSGLEDTADQVFMSFVNEDGSPDLTSLRYIGNVSERTISSEILNLVVVSDVVFYFTQGHSELSLNSQLGTGIYSAGRVLERFGGQLREINLLEVGAVPEDATALVIINPAVEFQASEVEMIADYVARGGSLFILSNPPYVDPTFGGFSAAMLQDSPLNTYLWEEFGVRFREDLIVEFDQSFNNEFTPIPVFTDQEIVAGLAVDDITAIFPLARTVEIITAPENEQQALYIREPLMYSTGNSFAETQLQVVQAQSLAEKDAADLDGPVALGVAVRRVAELDQDISPRVVLVGDSDWITNDFISGYPGNGVLWDAMANWVIQEPNFVSISGEEGGVAIQRDLLPITATDQERQRISVFTTVIMPALVLAVGVIVWFTRRRR